MRSAVLSLSTFGLLCLAQQARADIKPLSSRDLSARIDLHLGAKWAENNTRPSPLADDAEFLRRIYLDLAGRIPRVAEVRQFLNDKTADKRQRLIARLLESPQYISHLTNTWSTILLPESNNQQFRNSAGFDNWLREHLRANTPYDKMVHELLTATVFNRPGVNQGQLVRVNPNQSPAAFFQLNEYKPENLAASTTRVFLGIRLECAQCHDHPFASWTQDQFWQMAAFFSSVRPVQARVVNGKVVREMAGDGKTIQIPGKDKTVEASFLNGQKPAWRGDVDSRELLAEWVVSPSNPYFARTAANRVWSHFFGIGLIDPVDDEPSGENPISHPELLHELTEQFIAHKFDLKYLIQAIVSSKAYQRTSVETHPSQAEPRLFARFAVRGMTPEQFFDSLALAVGYNEAGNGAVRRVGFVNFNTPRGEFLTRFAGQERVTEKQTSILQALSLMNGQFISDSTSISKSTTLAAVNDAPFLSLDAKIETLYLATLSRLPRAEEMERLESYVARGGARNDSSQALADVFWALLNSSEFSLNH